MRPLTRVRPGDSPAADQQNAQTDAIEGLRSMSGVGGTLLAVADFGVNINGNEFTQLQILGRIINVSSDAEQDLSAGDIVQVGGLLNDTDKLDDTLKNQLIDIDIPASGTLHNMAVVVEEIKNKSSGRIMVSGFCWAKVVRENEDDEFSYANPRDGETNLMMSGYGIARVLWEEEVTTMTSEHWAWIEFPHEIPAIWQATSGEADEAITAKKVAQDGSVVGSDVTFKTLQEGS